MIKYCDEIKQFDIGGEPALVQPHGEGHINETYLIVTDRGVKYILQKINDRIFKDVPGLMNNIRLVTDHVARKVREAGGDSARGALQLIQTRAGEAFLCTNNGYFRMYVFIDRATSHQTVTDPEQFYQSAAAFGAFQNHLADFDASQLSETIPNFHNTVKRFEGFRLSLKADKAGRAAGVQSEIDFVLARENYCGRIVDLLNSGRMPLRVTHNDTKLNNVMLDDATGQACAVIDLDTVMPGSVCYDFGDSIRFGCNSAAEDEVDLGKVYFRPGLFETYARGYLGALKSITKIERDSLAFASILMTYECGMRFLADYLDGDVYFRIRRENQNLDRARTQFKLVSDMERQLPEMEETIKRVGR
ncbi:MAG: aminoglycoside phosphotransferase family protein [Firmicutes bacterium]|nr:aminoglycoside phosphotransferase family protein [Bacillota bacterium]